MSDLKPPRQAITIAHEEGMIRDTLSGDKQITLRAGLIDYRVGHTYIVCPNANLVVEADITEVIHTTLNQVSADDLWDDGFGDVDDALEQLKRFYPDLTLESPMTIVKWTNVRGVAVSLFNDNALYL